MESIFRAEYNFFVERTLTRQALYLLRAQVGAAFDMSHLGKRWVDSFVTSFHFEFLFSLVNIEAREHGRVLRRPLYLQMIAVHYDFRIELVLISCEEGLALINTSVQETWPVFPVLANLEFVFSLESYVW